MLFRSAVMNWLSFAAAMLIVFAGCVPAAHAQGVPGGDVLACGGEDEKPCDVFGFKACDAGLRRDDGNIFTASDDKCVNLYRRLGVGRTFRDSWLGRALKVQQDDLNWKTPLGRFPLIEAHNAYSTHADGYIGADQYYSITELLDAGIRVLELDVYSGAGLNGDYPKVCHGVCGAGDRHFAFVLKELRHWLLETPNRGEVIVINVEDHIVSGVNLVDAAIRGILDVDGIGVWPSSHKMPMPSRAEMVAQGKRVIFFSFRDNGDYIFDATAIYATQYSDRPLKELYPLCEANPGTDLDAHPYYGTKLWNGHYYPGGDQPTANQLFQVTQCLYSGVKVNSLLREGVDPDRLSAAIWSWAPGEPAADAAIGTAVQIVASTEIGAHWIARDPAQAAPYVCQKSPAAAGTPPEFAVTSSSGPFSGGFQACKDHGAGWEFNAVPRFAWDNYRVRDMLRTAGVTIAWLNVAKNARAQWVPRAPTVTLGNSPSVREGEEFTVELKIAQAAAFSDATCGTAQHVQTRYLEEDDETFTWTLTCATTPGQRSTTLAVLTGEGKFEFEIPIVNQVPTVERTGALSAMQGLPFELSLKLTDVAGAPLTVTVDWGDSVSEEYAATPGLLVLQHVFADVPEGEDQPMTSQVSVTVSDGEDEVTGMVYVARWLSPIEVTVLMAHSVDSVAVGSSHPFRFTAHHASGRPRRLEASCGPAGTVRVVRELSWPFPNSVQHELQCEFTAPSAANEVSMTFERPGWDMEGLTHLRGTGSRTLHVNGLPTITLIGVPSRVTLGENARFTITADDEDGGTAIPDSVSCGPAAQRVGSGWSQSNGAFNIVCRTTQPSAANPITVVVKDDEGTLSAPAVVTIRVTTPPAVSFVSASSLVVGTRSMMTFSVTATDGDAITTLPQASCGTATLEGGISTLGGGLYGFVCQLPTTAGTIVPSLSVDDVDGSSTAYGSVDVVTTPPTITLHGVPSRVTLGRDARFTIETRDEDGGIAIPTGVSCGRAAQPIGSGWSQSNGAFNIACRTIQPSAANTITVTVIDDEGISATEEVTIRVSGPPTGSIEGPSIVNEGSMVSFHAIGTATDGDDIAFDSAFCGTSAPATVDQDSTAGHNLDVVFACRFGDDAATPTSLLVTVHDQDGPETFLLPVSITNLAPGVTALNLPNSASEGQVISVWGQVTDPGGDAVSLTINWGDGSPAETFAVAVGVEAFSLTHRWMTPGTYEVEVVPVDDDGAAGTARKASIVVPDTSAPTLTVVDVTVTGSTPGMLGAAVTFSPVADDNVGVVSLSCDQPSGTVFPFGKTTVQCTAKDAAGNETPESFVVTVLDGVAPVVTVPADLTREATGPGGNPITFKTSASDNVSESLGTTCTTASGSTFAIRTTPVTCTATDAAGNTGSASFNVTVEDTIAPTVTYTGNALIYRIDQNIDIRCSATDGGSGVVSTTCADIVGPAHAFALGSGNNYSATATDRSGNTGGATASFTVNVSTATLQTLVSRFSTKADVTSGLNAKLAAAAQAPNANARAGQLGAFENQVRAQTGKALSADHAAILLRLVAVLK